MGKWSELPEDLLFRISSRLAVPDLLRFEAACTSWGSVVRERRGRYHPPHPDQSPWLMFSGDGSSSANFYSISEKRTYAIDLPPELAISRGMWVGSFEGWVVIADERSELTLLNPVTRQRIHLPPVSSLEFIETVRDSEGRIAKYVLGPSDKGFRKRGWTPEELRFKLYIKAVLSSSPASGDFTIVLLLFRPHFRLAFARAGDSGWSFIRGPSLFNDIAFHQGRLYTVSGNGSAAIWDFSGHSPPVQKVLTPNVVIGRNSENGYGPYLCCWYLVSAPWGDLLQVRRDRGGDKFQDYSTWNVMVYWVDLGSKTLMKMDNVGDHALFLGCHQSFCLPCANVRGLKGNCVYFTDEYWEFSCACKDMGIYNLKDDSIELVLSKDSRLNWPPPIWVMPSLT